MIRVTYTPRLVRDDLRWVSQSRYSPGYQTWPRAVGGKLVIRTGR